MNKKEEEKRFNVLVHGVYATDEEMDRGFGIVIGFFLLAGLLLFVYSGVVYLMSLL